MKRIGLISDTHGYWDDRYLRYFGPCDEIWHAGDIGGMEIINRLREFRPVRAVYGNADGGELRRELTADLRFTCEGADVLMTHIGGYPGHYDAHIRRTLYAHPPTLFISGHSHILKVERDPALGLLHINPGAAGLQGWHQVRTLVRLTIDAGTFKELEVIEIAR